MKKNKMFKVLTTSALVASLAAPIASPAFADTKNTITKVPSVADDYESSVDRTDSTKTSPVSVLVLEKDKVDNLPNQSVRLVLSNATWVEKGYKDPNTGTKSFATSDTASIASFNANNYFDIDSISDQTLTLNLKNAIGDGDQVFIPLYVEADGSGPITVEVQSIDGTITQGKYTIANASAGKTTTVVEDVKTLTSGSTGAIGDIRIDETAIGALYQKPGERQKVTLKLPANYEWNAGTIELAGGFKNAAKIYTAKTNGSEKYDVASLKSDERTLEFYLEFTQNTAPTTRGSIYVKGGQLKVDSAASYTDEVVLSVSGDKVSSQDVVVAKNKDYGIAITVDEVKNIVAGKNDSDAKTGKITIKENVAKSLVPGRSLEIKLPDYVKIVDGENGVKWEKSENLNENSRDDVSVNTDKNKITIAIPGKASGKYELQFKLALAVQADKTGDIEAVIKGAGIEEQKVVIAKAVAPITAEVSGKTDVKVGVQGQQGADIIITEGAKEAFKKSGGQVTLTLPTGVTFASTPKVEVVEGDLEIEKESVKRTSNDTAVVFNVKSESTKPSKIKVSGVTLTADRTVPEGQVELKIGGGALVDATNASLFNTSTAAKVAYANVITPAPGDVTASNVVFKLNSKTFTVDGKELTMDAAPVVAWDRAYLPVRFAANALNVSDNNIIWDDKTSTFTIFKGDRVITGKVGDKFLTVNGVKVPMDVPVLRNKAQTNNRVMVPIRYLSNVLNANIEWNKETSEITIQAKK